MFALESLIFQNNTVYIVSFSEFTDIIFLSAFFELYGLKMICSISDLLCIVLECEVIL